MKKYQNNILLETIAITKTFGDFKANDQINLKIESGQIHGLLGENGAGKSTLVKIIYGLISPDSGQVLWKNEEVNIRNPKFARELGIGMVFQHFSLFSALTVLENIKLSMLTSKSNVELSNDIRNISKNYGIPIEPNQLIADLSVGQKQRVEVVRCLLQNPSLLIMDEPTSVLTPQEIIQLFDVLKKLSSEGCSILFISHKLDEIRSLTNVSTILRNGIKIKTVNSKKSSTNELAELMVGKKISKINKTVKYRQNRILLKAEGINRNAENDFATGLKNIEFSLNAGKILGIAGISGNGQDELMEVLTGEWRDKTSISKLELDGKDIRHFSPSKRRSVGLGFVPEERNGHSSVTSMKLSENILIASHYLKDASNNGIINESFLKKEVNNIIQKFDVRVPEENPLASSLSGGNLQKFVVGREIIKIPKVLVVSQPTWGVDVGAARIIREGFIELLQKGSSILLISQDLDEIFALSDEISVIYSGKLSQSFPADKIDSKKIGLLMGGANE